MAAGMVIGFWWGWIVFRLLLPSKCKRCGRTT